MYGLGSLLEIEPLWFKQIKQSVRVELFFWEDIRHKAFLYIDAKDKLYRELNLNVKVWIYCDGKSIVTLPHIKRS